MDRFIIATGRCGSTLISRMVAEHSRVLVIQEFLAGLDRLRAFDPAPVDGSDFAEIVSHCNRLAGLPAARARAIPEGLLDSVPERFRAEGPPTILGIALPAISDDPVGLYDALVAEVRAWPSRPLAEQYRALFGWLRDWLGREVWIERSALSIEYLRELRRLFPDARYLHIHRGGPATALSMSQHPWFQLVVSFHFDPPTREELAQTEIGGVPISPSDPISQRLFERQPPIARFGEYWSWMIAMGMREVVHLDRDQIQDLRYEDLLADPRTALSKLADFFELPDDPGWLDRAAKLARPDRNPFDALSPADQQALVAACQPGEILLGRHDHPSHGEVLALVDEIRGARPLKGDRS